VGMREIATDILVAGGGLGGVAAALAAARLGKEVVLTEETDWLGGQLTAQAVPPDEHPWIENTGCTASYRRLRQSIRDYYRRNYPLLPGPRADPHLNPGMGFVSRLCHEPRVAVAVIEEMLAPYRASRRIRALTKHRPITAKSEQDRVRSVVFADEETGDEVEISAPYVLDATELGELLPMAGVEHVVGAESQDQTGEPHAVEGDPNPLDQQAITWCFTMDYLPGEDHTIEKPEDYNFWREYRADFWPGPQLGWEVSDAITHKPLRRELFAGPTDAPVLHDLWHFRRLLYRKYYPEGTFVSDVVLMNWAAMDYWLEPLVGVNEEKKKKAMRGARQLSLSVLYWLQTEAPRPDGGQGYPGLRLHADVVGTSDGLAKYPYIRESRRIEAEFTVLEQHVGVETRAGKEGAEHFHDSVGIGAYRIDLHPSTAPRNYVDIDTWPFQIPLGTLIPVRVENLLPACKNIGATHITNGCYRLHPVEWNIGEAAGALAAYCLENKLSPKQVRNAPARLQAFQQVLNDVLGIELVWPRYDMLSSDKRFGSPSAIHGGTWIDSDTNTGGLRASAPPVPE
jgi:hypothetical protein